MNAKNKSNRRILILSTALMLILAIWFCYICYKYAILACGIIILISMIMINVIVWLMEIRRIKLEEEDIEYIRGNIIKSARCSIEIYNDMQYTNGSLICYDNGFVYNEDDFDVIKFVRYEQIDDVHIDLESNQLLLSWKSISGKECGCSITSENSLRLKNILSTLSDKVSIIEENVVFE